MSVILVHDPATRCATCKHWWPRTEVCHRNAPHPLMLATIEGNEDWQSSTRTYWPRTSPRAWCGEHEPAAGTATDDIAERIEAVLREDDQA